jgi:hypothetical protein
MNPICLARFVWRSLRCGAWVSGHDYRTHPEPTPPNVHVVVCDTCGHQSVGWSWTSLEQGK